MSVAEAMGRALQQTSISTNIKERLDFSCALMNADGSLISNAPNVPVHLGESRGWSILQWYGVRLLEDSDDGVW
jgi:N-methylhydantoinase B/oxoprolinase/acetone carboxylase alpha subunit